MWICLVFLVSVVVSVVTLVGTKSSSHCRSEGRMMFWGGRPLFLLLGVGWRPGSCWNSTNKPLRIYGVSAKECGDSFFGLGGGIGGGSGDGGGNVGGDTVQPPLLEQRMIMLWGKRPLFLLLGVGWRPGSCWNSTNKPLRICGVSAKECGFVFWSRWWYRWWKW